MFHRRLVLLVAVIALTSLGLGAQLFKLSVVEGAQRLAEAESRLDRRTYLPTYRGRILDRHGRVLAEDRASYDIAVDYDVIIGVWAENRAARQARREIGTSEWNALSPERRDAAIRHHLDYWKTKTDTLWMQIQRLGKIDEAELIRRRDAIRAEMQTTAATVWERQRAAWLARFGMEEDAAEAADNPRSGGFTPRPIREQRQPHVILPRVSEEVAFEFVRIARELDGIVHVLDSRRREYPWTSAEVLLDRDTLPKPLRSSTPISIRVDGIADHVLGSVRTEVWEQDVVRRPFVNPRTGEIDLGGYRPGDVVGSRGLEAAFEDRLRGLRGVINERRDTGEQQRVDAVPGKDLHITLDSRLQARVQAILSHEYGLTRVQRWHNNTALPLGRPLNAAAVVVDVENGEILAMVSMPTIAMGQRMTDARRRTDDPWVNRAAEAIYPPGSIIKPLVLCAAVQEGVHTLGTAITCNGHYYEAHQDRARCWIYRPQFYMRTHGPLLAEEAMARSCNIYFYTLGDRLGMARLSNWFRRFGLGSPLDIGLLGPLVDGKRLGENGGQVPDEDTIAKLRNEGQLNFSSVIMGIGQGPVTWTPVQAANAYATLARGGIVRDATLVRDDERLVPRASRSHLGLPPSLVRAAIEGLRQSVEESYGTGHIIRYEYDESIAPDKTFNVEGVTVWAKTGTAQAPALPVDTTGDGENDSVLTGLSHAWTVGLVGPKSSGEPRYSIAVIVEYGGSGGRVAGPIVNQIIRALQVEGYLPNIEAERRARIEHSTGGTS